MKKALLALAAAAAVVTAGTPALASAGTAPVVHHARCTEARAAADPRTACDMAFQMGRRPGDVRVVIRASVKQHVFGIWILTCGPLGDRGAAGDMKGLATVRRHLLGQVRAGDRRCRMHAGLDVPAKGGTVTLVFSWVNR